MKTLILDGALIESMADVHTRFAEELDFPEWYGRNLDALYDSLTDVAEDVTVQIVNASALEAALDWRYQRLLLVLRDAAEENPHILLADEES